jgi:hypothetical protein
MPESKVSFSKPLIRTNHVVLESGRHLHDLLEMLVRHLRLSINTLLLCVEHGKSHSSLKRFGVVSLQSSYWQEIMISFLPLRISRPFHSSCFVS